MTKPNLFDFATNELSQDAFICWLLSWANIEYKNVDIQLHTVAKELLITLVKKKIDNFSSYELIEIKPQEQKIDILVIIDKKYALIIEDKVHTKNHSNQLMLYYEKIKKEYPEENIIPIYFKTGFQSNYDSINNFIPFGIEDFLKVLEQGKNIQNNIFSDYYNYLTNLSLSITKYETKLVTSWKNEDWIGFYKQLQTIIPEKTYWDYVANPSGGFMGFWWHFKETQDFKAYLLIEPRNGHFPKLCFKIENINEKPIWEIRNKWLELLISNSEKLHLSISKVKKFGSGKHQSIAILDFNFIVQDFDFKIDFELIKTILNKAQMVIDLSIDKI